MTNLIASKWAVLEKARNPKMMEKAQVYVRKVYNSKENVNEID